MFKIKNLFFVVAFFQSFISSQTLTPVDIHAVIITSEYIKPNNREENDNNNDFQVNTTGVLMQLRQQMVSENISAYIVLNTDEHQSEIVSSHDRRLKFISGFSGSNADAVITLNSAALWTDTRYFLQAEEELDCNWILMKSGVSGTPTIPEWISSQLANGDFVSTDSKLCSYEMWINWEKELEKNNIKMKILKDNLIDRIWNEENGRPPQVEEPIFPLNISFAGQSWQEKLTLIREDMKKAGVDCLVIAALDEIAWTLNLRGKDIPYFPVFHSYLIISMKEAYLYVLNKKITEEVVEHLRDNFENSVIIRPYETFWDDLNKISKLSNKTGLPAKFSYFKGISYLLHYTVPEEKLVLMTSPALIRKDSKNEVEVAGMKASHVRDGVAVCQFLAKLENDILLGVNNWTEISAAQYLNGLRAKQKYNAGISFATISAFGKNAAKAHYIPSPETDTVIDTTQLYMVDSGGQYLDGTTDTTRTVHFGTPRDIEREIYTRLLIGCIDVATVTFKKGYNMKELEILIRAPLFELGLDYGHGSTHGIGSFLGVHEAFDTTYHLNFFGSQEPGYYKDNEFGMRLENIIRIVKSPQIEKSEDKFFTFETITMIPYERKLIKTELMGKKHINWLNEYHKKVRELVGEEMVKQDLLAEYKWLWEKTEPITILE